MSGAWRDHRPEGAAIPVAAHPVKVERRPRSRGAAVPVLATAGPARSSTACAARAAMSVHRRSGRVVCVVAFPAGPMNAPTAAAAVVSRCRCVPV